MLHHDHDVERKIIAILDLLSRATEPLGARALSRELEDQGIELTERAVRYHLKILDERGLTQLVGKEGRRITAAGLEEVRNALIFDKVGLISTRIEALACQTTFDPVKRQGRVILNTSLLPAHRFAEALTVMRPIFAARLAVSDRVLIVPPGEVLADRIVPPGWIGFGTVCSVTVNGVLLNRGVPTDVRFGGILQFQAGEPLRFTDLIMYGGSSLDPSEIFIKGQMTSVRDVARSGHGKLLANLREVPAICLGQVERTLADLREAGLAGLAVLGRPSREMFGIAVSANRAGLVVVGGLNPLAAVEEAGLTGDHRAMTGIADYEALTSFWQLETAWLADYDATSAPAGDRPPCPADSTAAPPAPIGEHAAIR
ncbi:MAG TPA: NrpR regulatory domain-containing protein [Dehalococcoidia bacterium]|nr:NrpR regulatory domain-containing protein [Dehalococcoidia bacterium]